MRFTLFLAAGLAVVAPSASIAQPREAIVAGERICVYPGPITTTQRVLRVGLGQNCPATFINDLSATYPVPPTAQLRAEEVSAGSRRCAYQQAGTTWWRNVPVQRNCPLTAGLLTSEQAEPRR